MKVQCSRAGCDAEAQWIIAWRNPKIHAEDRHKQWTACDDHRKYLVEFLRARSFPVVITALFADDAADQDDALRDASTDEKGCD